MGFTAKNPVQKMERKGKKSKNEEQSNNSEETADVETSGKLLLKVLYLIQKELDTCKESERQTQVVQNIRKILEQTRENTWNGIQEEIHEEIPPEIQLSSALQIAVVVRHVLSNLNSSSLLLSRLVCKIWEEEATLQLLTQRHENVFKIRFEWNKRKGKYLHRNFKTLQDFHETCRIESRATANARKFLCSQTTIVFKGGDLRTTRDYFFNPFGMFVRFLSLKPVAPEENRKEEFKSTLHSILLDLTPNIEILTFKSVWTGGGINCLYGIDSNPCMNQGLTIERQENGEGGGFEKLRELRLTFFDKGTQGMNQRMRVRERDTLRQMGRLFQDHEGNPILNVDPQPSIGLIQQILDFAPNLQRILDPDLIHRRQILAAGKWDLVKHLDLKFPSEDSLLLLEFSAEKPKLTSLNLMKNTSRTLEMSQNPILNPNAAEDGFVALSSILYSSRFTLEHFHGVQHLKNISGISLFVFPLITKLCLALDFDESNENPYADPNDTGRILPPGFYFDLVFPNLISLQIQQLQDSTSNPFNFAGNFNANVNANANASSSLEHLEFAVKEDFSSFWMYRISSLYPNLTSLHVKIMSEWELFPVVCKSIWNCLSQLTELHLTVQIIPQRQSYHQGNGENEEAVVTDETDSVFTGFPLDLCRKLKQEDSKLPVDDDASFCSFDELRESPSVLNMKRLAELKISCVGIHPKILWSQVTEIHAFEKIKQRQNVKVQVTQNI